MVLAPLTGWSRKAYMHGWHNFDAFIRFAYANSVENNRRADKRIGALRTRQRGDRQGGSLASWPIAPRTRTGCPPRR